MTCKLMVVIFNFYFNTVQRYTILELHRKALFYAFGVDSQGMIKIPDRTDLFIEKLNKKGFVLDYEYETKLLQIENPKQSINLALCLKPVFSSMPVAYFIEFFDKENRPTSV